MSDSKHPCGVEDLQGAGPGAAPYRALHAHCRRPSVPWRRWRWRRPRCRIVEQLLLTTGLEGTPGPQNRTPEVKPDRVTPKRGPGCLQRRVPGWRLGGCHSGTAGLPRPCSAPGSRRGTPKTPGSPTPVNGARRRAVAVVRWCIISSGAAAVQALGGRSLAWGVVLSPTVLDDFSRFGQDRAPASDAQEPSPARKLLSPGALNPPNLETR